MEHRTRQRQHYRGHHVVLVVFIAIIAGLVSFWTGQAHAQPAPKTVTWVNATKNTDGSAIPATGTGALTRTTVEYGTCMSRNPDVFGTKQGEIFVAAPAQTLQLSLVVVQEYCLRAWHANTYAVAPLTPNSVGTSGYSNVAFTSIAPPSPGVPASLTVTSPTAYEMRTTGGKLVAYAVGTTQMGALCSTEERIVAGVSYRRVEHADLVVWPQKLPLEPWARCG